MLVNESLSGKCCVCAVPMDAWLKLPGKIIKKKKLKKLKIIKKILKTPRTDLWLCSRGIFKVSVKTIASGCYLNYFLEYICIGTVMGAPVL